MALSIGQSVYFRLAAAEQPISGVGVHTAIVTKAHDETRVNLKVLPDMADIFNAEDVQMDGYQAEGARCWSPWALPEL